MEYMTIEQASQRLGMEKAEFIGSAIEYNIWVGTILGPDKMCFFRGRELQPFLTRFDATVNTEKFGPLYVEYPGPANTAHILECMPEYDVRSDNISLNNIRIPHKELKYIKMKVGRFLTLKRKLKLNKIQVFIAIIAATIGIISALIKLF